MGKSRGCDYYVGKTLLVTGATGFLGKALIEALFDRLPGIRRIYVLLRPRTDSDGEVQSLDTTLRNEILASPVFERLRSRYSERFEQEVAERIVAVPGDLARDGLGLTPEWRKRLVEEVDIIINSAALAQFDAPLDQALNINALSPLRVLDLARDGSRRPFLAHVSTCYVNNVPGPVFETEPQAPNGDSLDPEAHIELLGAEVERIRAETQGCEETRRQRLERAGLKRAREKGWNDVYTLTKALGEMTLQRHRGDVPMLILRPSIIESSLCRPAPGWIEGLRMMDPLVLGYAKGRVFDFPGHPETVVDVVPLDIVVNALLMAIPYSHLGDAPDLFQVCTGTQRPLVFKELVDHLEAYYRAHPLCESARLPTLTFPETDAFIRRLNYRYLAPLTAAELASRPLARVPGIGGWHEKISRLQHNVRRLKRYAAIYGPYGCARMRFINFNTRALWQSMDVEDREHFPFSVEKLDWQAYLHRVHLPGLERYVLESPEACPEPLEIDGTSSTGDSGDDQLSHWPRACSMLGQTRLQPPEDVERWATPLPKRAVHRTNLVLMRLITRGYLGLNAQGMEHLPRRGPFVLVSNHTSHIDTGALLSALGGAAVRVHPIAASDYWFRSRWFGLMLHATLSAVPFDRSSRQIPPALALPAEILRLGHSLIFFPEGTRSPDGQLKPFKSSVGLLALATAAPLVPTHISGAYDSLPKGRKLMKPGSVQVRFGCPMRIEPYLDRLDSDSIARVASDIADDAHSAVEALQSASDNEPRKSGADDD